jgi:hypothetical protein
MCSEPCVTGRERIGKESGLSVMLNQRFAVQANLSLRQTNST